MEKAQIPSPNDQAIPNSPMTESIGTPKSPVYNLQQRTEVFAQSIRSFVKLLPRTIANQEDAKQLVRSSGSVGANYIEADEALSKKDFLLRMKICRKEAKETQYWLKLIDTANATILDEQRQRLLNEARQLVLIFSAILRKCT